MDFFARDSWNQSLKEKIVILSLSQQSSQKSEAMRSLNERLSERLKWCMFVDMYAVFIQ